MKNIFLFLLFFGLSLQGFSQSKDFILLKRGANQHTQIRFYPEENITYKSKKLGYFVTDKIISLDKDFIYLTENILSPADILAVNIFEKDPRNRTFKTIRGLLFGAGIIFLSAETINNLVLLGNLEIKKEAAITSSILIGTGLLFIPLKYRIFKHENQNKIQLVVKPI